MGLAPRRLYTTGSRTRLRVWDLKSGACERSLFFGGGDDVGITAISTSPPSFRGLQLVVVGCEDGSVRWMTGVESTLVSIVRPQMDAIASLGWSSLVDVRPALVAVGTQGILHQIDVETKQSRSVVVNEGGVSAAAISSGASRCVVAYGSSMYRYLKLV